MTDLVEVDLFRLTPATARVAARWLLRYMQAAEDVTIYDVVFVTGCLQALGTRHHAHALAALRDMADTATTRGARRGVT